MGPWFQRHGYLFFAGKTGGGKSFVALSMALAVASGGSVLGYLARTQLPVLYVDGEMTPADVQARLQAMIQARQEDDNGNLEEIGRMLTIISHYDQEGDFPDLASKTLAGQAEVDAALIETEAELLILDNLSTLCKSGGENNADDWQLMQDWIGRLRKGVTVCVMHHTGKADKETGKVAQRGTSRHEDLATSSILLSQTSPNTPLKLTWTKQRGGQAPADMAARIEWPPEEGCRLTLYLGKQTKEEISLYGKS